jgi:hypothetical protein
VGVFIIIFMWPIGHLQINIGKSIILSFVGTINLLIWPSLKKKELAFKGFFRPFICLSIVKWFYCLWKQEKKRIFRVVFCLFSLAFFCSSQVVSLAIRYIQHSLVAKCQLLGWHSNRLGNSFIHGQCMSSIGLWFGATTFFFLLSLPDFRIGTPNS